MKDKCVIDVEVYIGDSAIYLALNGAKEVIAVEHNAEVFELLNYNIKINGFSDLIRPVKNSCNKLKRPYEKLYLIAKGPIVLKVDCEGCEYNLFLINKNPEKLFNNIDEIIVEYHRWIGDPLKLIQLFRSLGYTVVTNPKSKNLGIIYAKHNKQDY